MKSILVISSLAALAAAQYSATYSPSDAPDHSEEGQSGTNKCGTSSSQTSMCQNAYRKRPCLCVNALVPSDFCTIQSTLQTISVYLLRLSQVQVLPLVRQNGQKYPGVRRSDISESTLLSHKEETNLITYQDGKGTRLIPDGTLKGVHFVKTPDYVQVTGVGDLTKINIPAGDAGGYVERRYFFLISAKEETGSQTLMVQTETVELILDHFVGLLTNYIFLQAILLVDWFSLMHSEAWNNSMNGQ